MKTPQEDGGSRTATSDDKPIIDPQYFGGGGGKIDFECMAQSQRFGDQICKTAPLSDIIVQRVFPPAPAPAFAAAEPESPAAAAAAKRTNGTTEHLNNNYNNNDDSPTSPPRLSSEEDFHTWVRDTTITDWHPMGTCAMAPSVSAGGVVDSRLRVHGVKGLRVVDASVMPLQISAHLQATVYAIGEKGAQMVREDFK